MRDKATKKIKILLIEQNITGTKLAHMLGTSSQNLFKKINNGTITLADTLQICEVLDLDIEFVKKIK